MSAPLVVVSLGTDHHRFDRAVDWIENWLNRAGDGTELFMQRGTSRAPSQGRSVDVISREEMLDLYRQATVVVTQVGPGTIMDVNSVGKVPIVIPRDPRKGEHVDGHQIEFGRFIAQAGAAVLAETEEDLHAAMTHALADPPWLLREPRLSPADATAAELARVIAAVMLKPAGFVRLKNVRRVFARH